MEILKAKDNGNGCYIVNDNMTVPNAVGNRHYAMVQEWIANGGVVEPLETAAEAEARLIAEANQAEYKLLEELDKQSIRDMREWIASQPNAPQTLKGIEAQAVEARSRIIK